MDLQKSLEKKNRDPNLTRQEEEAIKKQISEKLIQLQKLAKLLDK
jgi:hypothetical protein